MFLAGDAAVPGLAAPAVGALAGLLIRQPNVPGQLMMPWSYSARCTATLSVQLTEVEGTEKLPATC